MIAPQRHGLGVGLWERPIISRLYSLDHPVELKEGMVHGRGVMTLPGGAVYEGEYRRGKRNGRGTARFPDGRVKSGIWADGRLVEAD